MRDEETLRAHQLLGASGGLRPVLPEEGPRFARWELVSLAELALGETAEPDALTTTDEHRLRERLRSPATPDRLAEKDWRRRYWLLDAGGSPAGTLALDTWPRGWDCLGLSSLYVHPAARRTGLARRALDAVHHAALAAGLNGFQLHTHWVWQPTIRWYLARGLWVTSWKHDLGLSRLARLPRYEVARTPQGLTFSVDDGGTMVPLLHAGRDGDTLRLRRTPEYRRRAAERQRHDTTLFYAGTTLALHLALAGRPLVRDARAWEAAPGSSDIGHPEGLARKIRIFEESARRDGWLVRTPPLVLPADLPTPTWALSDGWPSGD
ncbi:GNAT family N-acetyltransferase [Streptomyces sp. S186]|uniref:GNAT family N-acetyltransferase n=1 Tax=Streptomyces sp. S186 TaxID=3434395 RepID=UPI003F66FA2D